MFKKHDFSVVFLVNFQLLVLFSNTRLIANVEEGDLSVVIGTL